MQDNTRPRSVRSEPFSGIESPTPRPSSVRFGENGLLVPAWSPESAGFGGQLARATYAASSETTQMGGLTPMGYQALRNANPDIQNDWWLPGYLENWWAGWNGDKMPAVSFDENAAFTTDEGAQPYLDQRFKDNPEAWDMFSDEMKAALVNSNSTKDVEFKIRFFGNQLEALDRIKWHDQNSGMLSYATNKVVSAGVNYVGADPLTNIATLGTAGATLKGVAALSKAGKTIQVASAVAAGSIEGGVLGALYEYNQTKFQNQLGNDLDTFDGQMIGWGMGLGAVGGLLAGVLMPSDANNRLVAALSEEIAEQPIASKVAAGMDDVPSMAAQVAREGNLAERAARHIKAAGARVEDHSWIFGPQLRYTTFKSSDEAVEWMETARPSKAELDQLSYAIADQVAAEILGQPTGRFKVTDMKTQFQKDGKPPTKAVANEIDDPVLRRINSEYNVARSIGIMQNIPGFSKIAGKLVRGMGGLGVRGKGVLSDALGGAAYAFQMLNPVGVRNVDMASVRTAAPSMAAAKASATNNIRKATGLQRIILRNNKEMRAAASNGEFVMSDIAGAILKGTKSAHAWANEIAGKLKTVLDDYGTRAEIAGLIDKAENYFPVLFNRGAIARHGEEFKEAFTQYLTKHFTKEGAELNKITVAKLKSNGTWGKDVKVPTKYSQLEGKLKQQYDEALPESLAAQAEASTLRLQGVGVESLLVNPAALEEGDMVLRAMRTDSTQKKTLPADIYLDDGMKPFLEQNINNVLQHFETNLAARTEFALGQVKMWGRAMEFPEVIETIRSSTLRNLRGVDEVTAEQRKEILKLLDEAQRAYDADMGLLPAKTDAFGGQIMDDIVAIGQNVIRTTASPFWGIAAATMEAPLALMQGSGYSIRELGDRLGDFTRAIFNSEYRWDNLAATADAVDALRVNLRGQIENSAHEGQYLGMTPGERLASPWINVSRTVQDQDTRGLEKILPTLNAATRAMADSALAAGLMPAITSAGRIAIGRSSERFVSRKLGSMRRLAAMLNEGVDSPKAFKGAARKAGFRSAQEASDVNASGLMDPVVLDFLEAAQAAGVLGRKGWDNQKIYEWAAKTNRLRSYRTFVNAQTEYVTMRMNYAFVQPNATSRVDVQQGDWIRGMFSMFMNFPAAFYQQRIVKQAQGDTISNGPALFAAYMGLEVLHRSIREISGGGRDEFTLNPKALAEDWRENMGQRVYRTITGGIPLTGLYPLGQIAETAVTGRPVGSNLTVKGLEGLFKHIRGTGEGAQRALEYLDILNSQKAN